MNSLVAALDAVDIGVEESSCNENRQYAGALRSARIAMEKATHGLEALHVVAQTSRRQGTSRKTKRSADSMISRSVVGTRKRGVTGREPLQDRERDRGGLHELLRWLSWASFCVAKRRSCLW